MTGGQFKNLAMQIIHASLSQRFRATTLYILRTHGPMFTNTLLQRPILNRRTSVIHTWFAEPLPLRTPD